MSLVLYTDGSSKGPRWPGGIAFVIRDANGRIICEHAEIVWNVDPLGAEGLAVLKAVGYARLLGATRVHVCADSRTLADQFNGAVETKSGEMREWLERLEAATAPFESFGVSHLSRDENREANELARDAVRRFVSKKLRRTSPTEFE